MRLFRKETILWATFDSSETGKTVRHDRRLYSKSRKSLKQLHDWLEETRKQIEKDRGVDVLITNFGIIR